MRVIDYNPKIRIPNLSEKDFNNCIIISYIKAQHTKFVSYVTKTNNRYYFRGVSDPDLESLPIDWEDIYNYGDNVLDLISREYNRTNELWKKTYYIIENMADLTKFVDIVKSEHENKFNSILLEELTRLGGRFNDHNIKRP